MAIEFVASLIVLSFLGLVNAIYLAWKHFRKKPLVCPLTEKCELVMESRWSHMFGVRNEVLGVLHYLLVLAAAITIFLANVNIKNIIIIETGGALLFSLFLVYLQARVIKNYCFYCLISAFISLLIFLNALIL